LTPHFALIQIKALKTMRDVVIEGDKVVLYGPNSSGKSTVIHLLLLALTKLSAGRYYNSDAPGGDRRIQPLCEEGRRELAAEHCHQP
jgi:ABC-type molybdenum transport system ATPase subunit/photorepair protein PhrA